jgi:hypothetical protein
MKKLLLVFLLAGLIGFINVERFKVSSARPTNLLLWIMSFAKERAAGADSMHIPV